MYYVSKLRARHLFLHQTVTIARTVGAGADKQEGIGEKGLFLCASNSSLLATTIDNLKCQVKIQKLQLKG